MNETAPKLILNDNLTVWNGLCAVPFVGIIHPHPVRIRNESMDKFLPVQIVQHL